MSAGRIAIAACIALLYVCGAFAAPNRGDSRIGATALERPTPRTSLHTAEPRIVAPKAARKTHRQARTPRHTDVFYRWSTEQLMLGGVDPAQIGKGGGVGGVSNKPTSENAASARQKPRASGERS